MISRSYTLTSDEKVPLSSFLDEFKISLSDFDVMKLSVSVDLDYSGVYYEGESPQICVIIEYDT